MKKQLSGLRTWNPALGIVVGFCFMLAYSPKTKGHPEDERASGLAISVRLLDYSRVSGEVMAGAKKEATKVFRRIGVEVAWLDCPTVRTEHEGDSACRTPLGSKDFALRILPRFASAGPGFRQTVGLAVLPAGGGRGSLANIFYARVEALAEAGNAAHPVVLGHALAHEIGHLLLGTNDHSLKGLMRGEWLREELRHAAQGNLSFTSEEGEKIRAQLQRSTSVKEDSPISSSSDPAFGGKILARVYNYARVPRETLLRAGREAMRIFGHAGAELEWLDCSASPTESMVGICEGPLRPGHFVLRILPRARKGHASLRGSTLATTLMVGNSGSMASIFYEYVIELAEGGRASRGQVLGHVAAHEIGHLLLGPDAHTARGLMRARWDRDEMEQMGQANLFFGPQQAEAIRVAVLEHAGVQPVRASAPRTSSQ